MRLRMVDLPHPDGPRMELNVPSAIPKLILSRTRSRSPPDSRYSLVTSCSVMMPTKRSLLQFDNDRSRCAFEEFFRMRSIASVEPNLAGLDLIDGDAAVNGARSYFPA